MTEAEWRTSTDWRAMWEFVATATVSYKTRWMGRVTLKRFTVSERKAAFVDLAVRAGAVSEPHDLAVDLRDVLDYLFYRGSFEAAWLARNDGAAKRLAAVIEATGEHHDMPILADALEDAGCVDETILSHCRQSVRHVRGCWVVELLLGRE